VKTKANRILVGLAGWSEATSRQSGFFPAPKGSGLSSLARYASAFDFVEINSSFYRQVRPSTCAQWAEEVPGDFRFSVKMHRLVTHYTRLKRTDLLDPFFASLAGLGKKLGAVLVQLPPSLAFDPGVAESFFDALRRKYSGPVACEPRHASWEDAEASAVLRDYRIGRVHTEVPAPAAEPGGAEIPVYVRLHGAPRRYYSAYNSDQLGRLAAFLQANRGRRRFVVFDNTASNAAVRNAAELRALLSPA
jgi:uncharacterized protein YecE (DUF72 family)